MKTAMSMMISVVLLATFSLGVSAQTVQSNEPLYGTWVNKEYTGAPNWDWKFIYQSDGKSFGWFSGKPADQPSSTEGRFIVDRKWQDAEGSTWYRVAEKSCIASYSEAKARRFYGLVKVLATGETLEVEWSTVAFPSEFGALGGKHYVYHRE